MIALSVIIPVYNSESWISRCLDSIVSQRFVEQFETILIDDGSTDGSGAICDTYARRLPNIRVFHTDNQGASLARKYGVEKALGQYVTFVDSDDYVKSGYLETLYRISLDTGCSIAACAVEGGSCASKQHEPQVLRFDELMPRFFKYEFWGFVAKIYSRDLFLSISFPTATISEDYYVMAQLFEKERVLAFSPALLYVYDHHPESLSRLPISKRAFEEFENVKAVFDFTSDKMPEFRAYALSNAVESAVKLLLASRKTKRYQEQKKLLYAFLKNHRNEIVFCKPLNPKTRILAVYCSL